MRSEVDVTEAVHPNGELSTVEQEIEEDPDGNPVRETTAIQAIYLAFRYMNDRQQARVMHWIVHRYGMTMSDVFPDYNV